ncbi:MAG TPA: amino acid ABC transporter permease [Candidatus Sulfotelmatobacter sp.]|nr:amino acid ABC transporter permease [Candidatus Sulfotelmatobacter sp.]
MSYTWHFGILLDYQVVFYRAAAVTIEVTMGSLAIGLTLGLTLGMMRLSRHAVLRWPAVFYIELFRSTPVLVQLVWIYYALPVLSGVQMGNVATLIVGLGLHSAAYLAEIFRAGILSIDRGQMDAAKAIGMGYLQAMRRIILPPAVRRMIPPFINEFATLMKLTTLGTVLAVSELLHESENLINNTYRPLEIYTVLALVFAAIIFPFIYLSQRLEKALTVRS